jgi:hypothetical protein
MLLPIAKNTDTRKACESAAIMSIFFNLAWLIWIFAVVRTTEDFALGVIFYGFLSLGHMVSVCLPIVALCRMANDKSYLYKIILYWVAIADILCLIVYVVAFGLNAIILYTDKRSRFIIQITESCLLIWQLFGLKYALANYTGFIEFCLEKSE